MCLLVEVMRKTHQLQESPPPLSDHLPWLWAGCPLVTIARCRPDHWRKTQSRVCVYEKVKETHILVERGSTEGVAERESEGFNDAENWPVTVVHPSGKSLLQLAVNLSVPLSSHLAPPMPRLCLAQAPPPHPDLTSFTTTYSKLPSSSHTHPVTINNCSHVSVCISKH